MLQAIWRSPGPKSDLRNERKNYKVGKTLFSLQAPARPERQNVRCSLITRECFKQYGEAQDQSQVKSLVVVHFGGTPPPKSAPGAEEVALRRDRPRSISSSRLVSVAVTASSSLLI